MTKKRVLVAVLAILLTRPVFADDSNVAARAQRLDALSQQHPRPADLAFAETMRSAYTTEFGALDDVRSLRNANDAELKLHWAAVESAAFYSDSSDLADAALRIYTQMRQRRLTDTKQTERLFDFLLKARRFAEARAFAASHPEAKLPGLPEFIDAPTDQPSVWRMAADGRSAERIGIDLQPLQIIVVAGCHFSADAARDIGVDPLLGPIFTSHARWLSLPPGAEQLDALAEWNQAHPKTPMLPIHDRREWSVISAWAMPTFAIIRGGKLIDSTRGWKSGDAEFRRNLIALLQRTGLLEASASQPAD